MEITFETVEKLHEKTGASFAEARAALERSGGDLLDAVIDLERQGKSSTTGQGGSYSTRPGGGTEREEPEQAEPKGPNPPRLPVCRARRPGENRRDAARRCLSQIWRSLLDNQLEVWRRGEQVTSMPVLVLILLAVFFFWITAPLLLIGLLFGCRYRFSGPELGRQEVNQVMDRMSDTLDEVRENVRRDMERGFRKDGK